MALILDTNIAIHLIEGDPLVMTKVKALGEPPLLSVVSRMELEGGVYRDPDHEALRRTRLDAVLRVLDTLAFDSAAADAYRAIVAAVGYSRRKVIDRMIAAQALTHQATLVTRNPADFADIPGLTLETW